MSSIRLSGSESLVLDTVKRGEDDEDVSRGDLPKRAGRSVILRIYDSLGGTSRGTIETLLPVKRVWKCNALEDDESELEYDTKNMDGAGADGELEKGRPGVRKTCVDIELRPFEVATYRLQL